MTWDEIQSLNLGVDGLVNEEAKSRYEASVAGLPDRPDLSGLLSLGKKYVGKSYARAYDDRYDFDIKKSIKPNVMMRNALTVIGEWIAGSGTPYSIQFYGTAKLNPIFPWTK